MIKLPKFLLIPVVLLSLACQLTSGLGTSLTGSGNVVSENRPVKEFNSVSVCCGMHLILTQSPGETLKIEADDNLLPEIESFVTNGKLVVRFKNTFSGIRLLNTNPIQVEVSAPELVGVDMSGGSRLEAAGPIQTPQMGLDFSGGSRGSLANLQAEILAVDLTGGSRIELAGIVPEQAISLSGGSDYLAGDLQSRSATLEMSGGGRATLWASETLNADLSGGAIASYYGHPNINQSLSGGSRLQALGEK